MNTTPKKTVTNLKIFEDGSPPIPDLRLEAKMSAEVSHHALCHVLLNIVLSSLFYRWISLYCSILVISYAYLRHQVVIDYSSLE